MIGFNVGYAGFTGGASFADNEDSGCDTADGTGCNGGEFFDVAVGYSTGPFGIGVGYFASEKDNGATAGGGSDEVEIFSITGQYSLAPGLALYSEVNFIDEDNDSTVDNDGTVFMLGASASF
jgi:predicted porin